MLVGTCPFKGSNEVDLLNNIKNKNLVIPNEVEISPLSLDVLSKLLERVPDKRATVAQLMVLKSHLPRLTSSAATPEEPSSRPRSASRPTTQEEEEEAAVSHPSQASTHGQPQSSTSGGPILVSQQARTQQLAFGNLNPSTATAATTLSMSPPGISYRPQNPNASPSTMNATGFYDSAYSQPIIHSSQKHHSGGAGKGMSSAESSSSGRRHSVDSALSPSYSHSNNTSSSAAGIIGNLGKAINFMMYSPSHRGPSNNNSGANMATLNPRSHGSGKYSPPHAHQGNSYEKRSASLDRDRGVPPPFAPPGAQPASGRTRQHSSAIPLHHQQPTSFYPEDSYGSGRQFTSEGFDNFGMPLHSVSPSHASLSNHRKEIQQADAEDDFVFIPSSSSGSSGNSGEIGRSSSSQALHQDPAVSDLTELPPSSSPNPYHHGDLHPLNRQATQNSQLFQIDELSPPSTSLFLSNVTQRCHITCTIVHEITSLGDEFIQKAINSEYVERNSASPKQATTAVIARGGNQRRSNSGSLLQTPAAIVDSYLVAISLYFHALNILKNLMGSITEGAGTGPRTSTDEMISKIREVSC